MPSTFNWQDPFLLEEQLTASEKQIRDSAATFAARELMPRVVADYKNESADATIIRAMGEAGLLGAAMPEEWGGANAGYVAYGLIAREIERVDSGYRSMFSVQASLAMHAIHAYGEEPLKQKWLPKLISGEAIGCFGLTEPEAGSDPSNMRAAAEKHGDEYKLNGVKSWISNSPLADVFVVWARSAQHDNKVRGFILEKETPGLTAPKTEGKLSLRAGITGDIIMDNATIPAESMLTTQGLKGAFECLNRARYGICWGSIGAAESCWHAARDYGMNRRQFGSPLAQKQLYQKKLADMQTEISLALQASLRLGRMREEGTAAPELISLIKRNNCAKALTIAREARDMHGANGISEAYHVIRHMSNLETVNTYEGTNDIHALILGRAQTDLPAF